jgi:hypothetical protein
VIADRGARLTRVLSTEEEKRKIVVPAVDRDRGEALANRSTANDTPMVLLQRMAAQSEREINQGISARAGLRTEFQAGKRASSSIGGEV